MVILNGVRRALLPRFDGLARRAGRPLTRDKTDSDEELLATTDATTAEIARGLRTAGFKPNPVSTLKYVVTDDGKNWETLSMAHRDSLLADWQTHVYVIPVGGERRIYAHKEPSITRPFAHQSWADATPGDPDGLVPDF